MKDLSKKIFCLFFAFISVIVFSQSPVSDKYIELIEKYIEKEQYTEAERYVFFVKNSEEGDSDRLIDLEIKIKKNILPETDYIRYLEAIFEKYKNRRALEELIDIEKDRYFSFEEFERLLKIRIEVYPDNFTKEYIKNIVFFKESGLDIIEANKFRKYSEFYIQNYQRSQFTDELAEILLMLNSFELQRFDKVDEIIETFDYINGEDELLWYLEFFFDRDFKYEIKNEFFKLFSLFSEYVFHKEDNDNLIKTLKLKKDNELYRNLILSYISEEKERIDDALFYTVKTREYIGFAVNPYTEKRLDSTIERLKIKTDTKKIERRVVDLESSGEYEEALKLAYFLPDVKKTYYEARILYYYFHNYEKVLKIINSSKKTTPEIDFIKGQVYIKSSLYDEAEKIFLKMSEEYESEFFESAVWNVAYIYFLKGADEDLRRFGLDLWEKYGNVEITGKIFLKYAELLENIGRSGQAGDVIKFILFNFSDKKTIFDEASERYEKNNLKVRIDDLKREVNDSIIKLKSDRVSNRNTYSSRPDLKTSSTGATRRRRRFSSNKEDKELEDNVEEYEQDSFEIILDSDEIEAIIDTAEISNQITVSTQEIGTFREELLKKGNTILEDEEKRKKEIIKNKLPGLLMSYFSLLKEIEDYDSQVEMAEKLIQYSSEVDFPQLRNIATVALAEASIEKVGDIEKVIQFFYSKIREYVRKYSLDKQDNSEDILSDFYLKAIEFFADKKYLKEAYELCENYYNDIDPSYKKIDVLKEKISIAIELGQIEKKDLEKIINKDKVFIDKFIIEKELFENHYIADLGNRLRELENTYKIINDLSKFNDIEQRYKYFRDNNMKQKIADDYYNIIGTFKDSFEVYAVCWDCLIDKQKYNDASQLYGIISDRFPENIKELKEKERLLSYIFENYDTFRILENYAVMAPVNEKYIEKIDLSGFSRDFIFSLLELDSKNIFLRDYYISILLKDGNSSEIMSFLQKYNDVTLKVFNFYIKNRDYELLDYYFNQFSEYANPEIINYVNIYRAFINKKNSLNTSDTSSKETIEEIIRMAVRLGLFDEALNYTLVLNRVTGIDVEERIQDLNIEKNIFEINNAADGNRNDFLLAKQYMIYINSGKDTQELDISENIIAKAKEVLKIEEELKVFNKDTVEIKLEENIKDTQEQEITYEIFEESLKKNKKDKAMRIGNKLIEKGNLEIIPELGLLYEEKRDYKKAIELYRDYIINNLDSEVSPELQYKIGLIAMKERDEDKAVSSFERLLRYFPEETVYTVKASDRIEQIILEGITGKEFQEELDLFDKSGDYNEINRFQDISDNIDEIKDEISKTNDTYRLSQLHYKLGEIYFEKFKKYDEALNNYNKAREYGENDISLIEKIADCLIKQKKYEEAISNYETYIESLVDPEEKAEITLKIIRIYTENLKQYSEALEKINVYIAEYSFTEAYYEVLYYKGKIYEDHYRDYTEAINHYNILVPEFGSDFAAKAQFRIAYIYEKYLKQYNNAKTAYEKILNDFTDFDLKTQAEDALRRMLEDGKIQ